MSFCRRRILTISFNRIIYHMNPKNSTRHPPGVRAPGEDSAVCVLRQLEGERGRLFSESEYRQMRRSVVDELALGAQRRPLTLFTFAVVGLGLFTLLALGIITHREDTSDFALMLVSGAALLVGLYLFRSYLRGLRLDALRPLQERLDEVERLRELCLISREEYEYIHSSILISRQRSDEPRRPER